MYVQNQSYFFHWNQPKKKNRRNVLPKLCYTWNVQINKIGIKRFRTILKIHTFKLVTQH
jgi:hypothetical protein